MEKKNWFVRILVILLILFVAAIILASFFFSEKRLLITAPIIFLIAILVILSLAEIFDNFSIGNFLSLQKEHRKVESELRKIENENRELRLQLTNIISNVNSNHNTTIYGQIPEHMGRILGVEKAKEEEVQKKKQEEETVHSTQSSEINSKQPKIDFVTRRRIFNKLEEVLLIKYCEKYDINIKDVSKEMKFSEGFIDTDPIMEKNVIFDAYYKAPWQEELFIEICYYLGSISMLERFYHLLSKVYHYRVTKKLQAKLVLVVPSLSEKMEKELSYNTYGLTKERFCKYFSPAIRNNLLDFMEIEISDEEVEKIKQQCQIDI